VPRVEKLQLAKAALKRGSICHWEQPFGNHFAVILNLRWPPSDDVVFFSIMTSSKFPGFVENEIIRTGPRDYGFLTKETVIDLRHVHAAKLSAIVSQRQFAAVGALTSDHIERANEILRASMTVPQDILDQVVAG
jgi:hypothetical protein